MSPQPTGRRVAEAEADSCAVAGAAAPASGAATAGVPATTRPTSWDSQSGLGWKIGSLGVSWMLSIKNCLSIRLMSVAEEVRKASTDSSSNSYA